MAEKEGGRGGVEVVVVVVVVALQRVAVVDEHLAVVADEVAELWHPAARSVVVVADAVDQVAGRLRTQGPVAVAGRLPPEPQASGACFELCEPTQTTEGALC